MAKASVYTDLFNTKTLVLKDFINHGDKPYIINFSKTLSNPVLFDNITLLIEKQINTKDLKFDKICAASISALPYATNIATSFEKPISYILNTNNDTTEQHNIKNIKIEGGLEIDEKILLIETFCNNDFYLENIIERIVKYGGTIVGVIIILNMCEGEYVNLIKNNQNIITIINLYDIFNHLENNNLIELFYSEKIKFHCEKNTKININKLLHNNILTETPDENK